MHPLSLCPLQRAIRLVGDDMASVVLLSLELRCACVAHDGAPVIGVSPVCPSTIDSRPNVNSPLDGVVSGTPRASVMAVVRLGIASDVGRLEVGCCFIAMVTDRSSVHALSASVARAFSRLKAPLSRQTDVALCLCMQRGLWACSTNSSSSFSRCRRCSSFFSSHCSSSRHSVSCRDKTYHYNRQSCHATFMWIYRANSIFLRDFF